MNYNNFGFDSYTIALQNIYYPTNNNMIIGVNK